MDLKLSNAVLEAVQRGLNVNKESREFIGDSELYDIVRAARVIRKLQPILAKLLSDRIGSDDDTITVWARKLELSPQLLRAILRKPAAKPPPGGWPKRTTLRPSDLPGVSVPVAARKLGISPTTAYARVRSGELPSVTVLKTHRDGAWLRVLLDE